MHYKSTSIDNVAWACRKNLTRCLQQLSYFCEQTSELKSYQESLSLMKKAC